MEKLMFNSSMPRAGSELIQVILHQNPAIYASSTSPLLEYQFAARANFNLPEVKSQPKEIMETAFLAMCNGMAQSYYAAVTDRPIVIDKNRGWSHYYEWVTQWNGKSKMICMVRDLRSILASFERIYRNTRFNPEGPDNPNLIQNMTVAQRMRYWLTTQPVGLALQRTLDLFQRGVAKNIHFVRYEDLCNTPVQTLRNIYDYLEVEPFAHDFNYLVKEVAEDDSHFGIFGSHYVKAKIVSVTSQSWADVIPLEFAKQIKADNLWYFDTLY